MGEMSLPERMLLQKIVNGVLYNEPTAPGKLKTMPALDQLIDTEEAGKIITGRLAAELYGKFGLKNANEMVLLYKTDKLAQTKIRVTILELVKESFPNLGRLTANSSVIKELAECVVQIWKTRLAGLPGNLCMPMSPAEIKANESKIEDIVEDLAFKDSERWHKKTSSRSQRALILRQEEEFFSAESKEEEIELNKKHNEEWAKFEIRQTSAKKAAETRAKRRARKSRPEKTHAPRAGSARTEETIKGGREEFFRRGEVKKPPKGRIPEVKLPKLW